MNKPNQKTSEVLPARVASFRQQVGAAEKNVAKLLDRAGLAEAVMTDKEFYLPVPNEPFIPLVIERQGPELRFTHYVRDAAEELYIETEMVFYLGKTGQLALRDVASNAGYGEFRSYDRGFAKIFSRNLLAQGFVDAAKQVLACNATDANKDSQLASPAKTLQTITRSQVVLEIFNAVWADLEQSKVVVLDSYSKPTLLTHPDQIHFTSRGEIEVFEGHLVNDNTLDRWAKERGIPGPSDHFIAMAEKGLTAEQRAVLSDLNEMPLKESKQQSAKASHREQSER